MLGGETTLDIFTDGLGPLNLPRLDRGRLFWREVGSVGDAKCSTWCYSSKGRTYVLVSDKESNVLIKKDSLLISWQPARIRQIRC